jgi:predicted permease
MRGHIRELAARIGSFFRKGRLDSELDSELASHLEMAVGDNVRRGMSPDEARRQARVRFGTYAGASESHREARGLPALDSFLQDLRYTLRSLRRDSGFTTFAILIVGLGIGASSTVFSVVNTLLLRPLPFPDSERLVWVANGNTSGLSGQTTQVGYLVDLRRKSQSFSDLAAYFAFYSIGGEHLTESGEPERLTGVPVTQNFFPLLGVQPMLGRLFTDEECRWNGPRAVLLSYGLWQRRFNADPAITGRQLTINDRPVTVAGVLPRSFDFSTVFAPGTHVDLYTPFPLTKETNRWGNTLAIVGRLKPGVGLGAAKAEIAILADQLTKAHAGENSFEGRLSSLAEHVSGRLRLAVLVLACAVLVVMLIVCANLSNLLLARAASRHKEMAIRTALGAARGRLIRQMLTESMTLSCCGAVLGLALAIAGTRALSRLEAVSIPLLHEVRTDVMSLGFILVLAIVTGVVFGLAPALQSKSGVLHDALKEGGRGGTDSKQRAWMRGSLVVAEIAFACVLLVGAGLLIRSFMHVLDVDLGFHPERAAAIRVDPGRGYTTAEQFNNYWNEVLRRARNTPGIEAAGISDVLPLGVNRSWGAGAKGRQYPPGQYPDAFVRVVSDGYIRTMGIPLRAGRDFTERDGPGSEPVLLVNETMARTLFPGENPIGQMIALRPDRRIVGVVGDVRHLSPEASAGMEMYLSIRQTRDWSEADLVVRTTLAPAALASAVRSALRPIQPNLATNDFRTIQQLVDKAVSPRRFLVLLLGAFALFALVLASLGIYGVISYSVSQRAQEIGIRMALGASAAGLQRRIIRQTLGLAAVGMALGTGASWALARAVSGLLFGVTSTDPATFVGMVAVLTTVAAVAGYLPARRATRRDPMAALRAS